MGQLAVMGREGDTKIIWDPGSKDEVKNAKRTFDELIGKGFMAYAVNKADASKGKQVREFDPKAEKLILAPPMAGG